MAGIDVTICPITNGGDVDGISDLTIVSPRSDRKSFFSGPSRKREPTPGHPSERSIPYGRRTLMDDRFFGPQITDEELDTFNEFTAGDDTPYLDDGDIDPDVSDIIDGWA